MLKLKCPHCGSYLGLETMYDGCDWQSAAGAGSGFGYVIALTCPRHGGLLGACREAAALQQKLSLPAATGQAQKKYLQEQYSKEERRTQQ